jgi:phosphoglycerate dehydrogenase-like enzyme
MISMVHIAHGRPAGLFPEIFLNELKKLGSFEIIENGKDLSEEEKLAILQKSDVAITGWNSCGLPSKIVDTPGKLKYVCNLTGEMSGFVPKEIIASNILVSNWGDSPSIVIAEGAMSLLLATLKDLHLQINHIEKGNWNLRGVTSGGSLYDEPVGVYGCGVIGTRFVKLVQAFGAEVNIFDPYSKNLPEGCNRVDSLEDLFKQNRIITIFAGLSEETKSSVNEKLLSYLPDNGVIINTARGGIIDQDALFSELGKGRLRAGLDVLDPDSLPEEHPARKWPNLILSAHEICRSWPSNGEPPKKLGYMHKICIDNLKSFSNSEPIKFEMTLERFERST